jgi:hypothetical protein
VLFGDDDLEAVRKFVIDHRNVERFSLSMEDVGYQ